jgi:hypothetical protein
MISRRGFFGLLGALAASPVLAPVMKFFPETGTYLSAYYSKDFIRNLYRNSPFQAILKERPTPLHSGKTIQFFTYQLKEAA